MYHFAIFSDCPACYNLVQDAVDDIRQGLIDLGDTLKNINENPNVADDEEFTNQLDALNKNIMELHDKATELQSELGSLVFFFHYILQINKNTKFPKFHF